MILKFENFSVEINDNNVLSFLSQDGIGKLVAYVTNIKLLIETFKDYIPLIIAMKDQLSTMKIDNQVQLNDDMVISS